MKILVLGSGLLGVSTAYELAKRGHSVEVLDRQPASAMETSFANGGQLSYNHAEPWASRGVLKKLPKWLIDPEAPLVFHLRADKEMFKWGLSFLRNCTDHRARINCVNILRLGLYSRDIFAQWREETGIQYDFAKDGILHIYSKDEDFDHAKTHNAFQAKFGGEQKELTREEVLALEPVLSQTSRKIVGGIHAFKDECGDPFLFCNALAKVATEKYGVTFRYGVTIEELVSDGKTIQAVKTSEGDISADGYIMAMGSYSPVLLRKVGIDVPIYPMKGYSITIPTNENCPRLSITDGTFKIVYSRLGDRMRVAGTAEFAGHNHTINEKRITPIVRAASELLPGADWKQEIKKWACLRPSTPDGPPIIGPSRIRNLFLNTGHGTLGWTQAAGSATLLADIMEGKTPGIMMHGLTIDRY